MRLFTGEPYMLMQTVWGARAGIVFADAWMWSPFVMLLVLAGLVSVPKYLYEAAAIDRVPAGGSSGRSPFPISAGLLLLALLFRTIEAFKLFDLVFLLTEGGRARRPRPSPSTSIASRSKTTGPAKSTALAYILLFTVIVLTNLYLYFANRRAKEA